MAGSLILASCSPQRAALLKKIGIAFRVFPSGASERVPDLPPARLARLLALRKVERIRGVPKDRMILSADTLVSLGDRILGKPRSLEEAERQLRLLAGREHTVITGVALKAPALGLLALSSESSQVSFRPLSAREIQSYVKTREPLGKAGSYAIQGKGRSLISRLEGDYYNVVGLPLALLWRMGKDLRLGIAPRRLRELYRLIPAPFRPRS